MDSVAMVQRCEHPDIGLVRLLSFLTLQQALHAAIHLSDEVTGYALLAVSALPARPEGPLQFYGKL